MTINTQKLRDLIRQACPLPWTLATSNSWRRIVDQYHASVCSPCTQRDGHPDLAFPGGAEGPTAQLLLDAANALPGLLDKIDAQEAQLAAYPADWREDSSLETWFPLTAEQMKAQAAEIARLREAAQKLADWAEHEVGAEPDLTPGLAEVCAALAQEGS
uniref:hypothetical protein n=1 Tax=Castellaniella defragrans TaxID=75697 RepID=UPI00333FA35C